MKKIIHIARLLCCTALMAQLTGCGLLDFEVDDDLQKIVAKMRLDYDTLYVERGDTMQIRPMFDPDTLKLNDVLVMSSDPEVVTVNNLTGLAEAVGTGWCKLYVESVFARLKDSCSVCVLTPFVPSQEMYPYETVFYADVTLNGEPLTEDMVVGAFVGEECRGVGEDLSFFGVPLMQLRVGADRQTDDPSQPGGGVPDDPDDPDDPPVVFRDRINFRLYDRKNHWLYRSAQSVEFDGATHGTLSRLYKIEF